jgi:hypothetical protein
MPSTNAQHSKEEIRWGTPIDIVERARKVMGTIDLDPCSSVDFNRVVNADNFYSLDDRGEDGLVLPWWGNVFVNPPGGLVKQFWRKAFSRDNSCNKYPPTAWNQMIWVGFSVEQLALLADEEYHPMDFSFCILRKRLKFTRHDGYSGSPSHANYVCGVNVHHQSFAERFSPLGRVYRPGK